MLRLILQASGYVEKKGGGASLGNVPFDAAKMYLRQAENTGTVFQVPGLLHYITNLWQEGSPYRSESKLNRFLIRLGKALASTQYRGTHTQLDWTESRLNQTEWFIVHGWCEHIIVDEEPWPILCRLSVTAIREFLCQCKRPLATGETDESLRKRIERLGLKSVPVKHRIRKVVKRNGQLFAA